MSHLDFKKWQCRMSLSLIFAKITCRIKERAMSHVTIFFTACHMSVSLMLHVQFQKCPCRPVDFRGQEPYLAAQSRGEAGIGLHIYYNYIMFSRRHGGGSSVNDTSNKKHISQYCNDILSNV